MKTPMWLRRGAGFSVAAIALSSMAFGPASHNVAFAAPTACATSSSAPTYISADGNFQISNAEQLIYLSQNYDQTTGVPGATGDWRSQDFVLTSDIDLGGCNFTPIGDTDPLFFNGSFDGMGLTISGLVSQGVGNRGLFGSVETGSVQRLTLADVNIASTNSFAGGLAGTVIQSVISQVKVTGRVSITASTGTGAAGGITGSVQNSDGNSGIFYSVANVNVSNVNRYSGGFAGFAGIGPKILDSYARGSVSGSSAGGFFAEISSSSTTVNRNFSTGAPSGTTVGGFSARTDGTNPTVSNSFWDTETSGLTTSIKGIGKTTAEMTSFSTFDDAGWSIVEGWRPFEPGIAAWGICSAVNDGYPFLLWEYDADPCNAPATSTSVSAPNELDRADVAAIHLDAQVQLGEEIAGHSILAEGQGLAKGEKFLLVVNPVRLVLASGEASRLGYFSVTPKLSPSLPDGSYTLVLSTVAPDGTPLTLEEIFGVVDGRFSSAPLNESRASEEPEGSVSPSERELRDAEPSEEREIGAQVAEEAIVSDLPAFEEGSENSDPTNPVPVWPILWVGLGGVALAVATAVWLRRASGLGPS